MRLPSARSLLQSGRFDILFFFGFSKSNFIGSKIQNTISANEKKKKIVRNPCIQDWIRMTGLYIYDREDDDDGK